MTAPIIAARAVTRDYRAGKRVLHALRGVDLAVEPGETLGIVGESGCGKSTLARLLLGIEPPSSGTVAIEGKPIAAYHRLARAALIQPVFQDPYSSLNPRMTVGGIIAAPLEVRREGTHSSRLARVHALMETVGLPPHLLHAYPGALSGGQRQRVAIARALIAQPRILICDEPTSALDVSVQSQILNLLARLRREFGLTMILISHNLAVVNHLADRIAVMYLGRIVERGRTEAAFRAPRHPYTAALLEAVLAPVPGARLPDPALGAEFPSPLDPPPGCAFHPRCPRAGEICARVRPAGDPNGRPRVPLSLSGQFARVCAEIEAGHGGVGKQGGRFARHDDAAAVQDVAAVADLERLARALLDQEHGGRERGQGTDRSLNTSPTRFGESAAVGSSSSMQLRAGHQRAGEGELLALAAGQQARAHVAARGQRGEPLEHVRDARRAGQARARPRSRLSSTERPPNTLATCGT